MLNQLTNNPLSFIIFIPVLLFTIAIHEYAHAKTADYLGDPTARLMGRITLNPLAHIDLYGMFFLFLFGFGWGKPVPFDPFNLKNPRRDAALISIAGPISNFSVAIICALLLKLFIFFKLSQLFFIGQIIFVPIISFNLLLGVFNLIPVGPLDGFKVVGGILPENRAREWYQLEKYGIFFLLALLIPINGHSMLSSILNPTLFFLEKLLLY